MYYKHRNRPQTPTGIETNVDVWFFSNYPIQYQDLIRSIAKFGWQSVKWDTEYRERFMNLNTIRAQNLLARSSLVLSVNSDLELATSDSFRPRADIWVKLRARPNDYSDDEALLLCEDAIGTIHYLTFKLKVKDRHEIILSD